MKNPTKLKIPKKQMYNETPLAYCFDVGGRRFGIAKSQVRDFQIEGEDYTFWVPEWLMKSDNLEAFKDTSHEPGLFD